MDGPASRTVVSLIQAVVSASQCPPQNVIRYLPRIIPDQQPSSLDYESVTPHRVEMISASRATFIGICITVSGVALAMGGLHDIRRAPGTWPAFLSP